MLFVFILSKRVVATWLPFVFCTTYHQTRTLLRIFLTLLRICTTLLRTCDIIYERPQIELVRAQSSFCERRHACYFANLQCILVKASSVFVKEPAIFSTSHIYSSFDGNVRAICSPRANKNVYRALASRNLSTASVISSTSRGFQFSPELQILANHAN